ncbi:MAG: hypothetical protein ACI4LQ_01635, partial [Anaerovoracaceae bacterium]
ADDTWWEAAWESRTLPVFFFFCFYKEESGKNWEENGKRLNTRFFPFFFLAKSFIVSVSTET